VCSSLEHPCHSGVHKGLVSTLWLWSSVKHGFHRRQADQGLRIKNDWEPEDFGLRTSGPETAETRETGRENRDCSLMTIVSRGKDYTNPKRERGIPQVTCGARPAPSLTLRVGMGDDYRCGPGSARAEFPGGVQRGPRENLFRIGKCIEPTSRTSPWPNRMHVWTGDGVESIQSLQFSSSLFPPSRCGVVFSSWRDTLSISDVSLSKSLQNEFLSSVKWEFGGAW
jgi:hypothetical protein